MSYIRSTFLYGSEAWCLLDENLLKDRMIHGESNAWSTAKSQKKIYGFDVHVGFE